MKTTLLITVLLLTSCTTLVTYEGCLITQERYQEITAYQHKIFDLGEYDQDMSMSVKNPNEE